MNKQNDFIILHGTKGSPDGNWFPWLSSEIKKNGLNVFTPQLPTPENQSLDSWFLEFDKQIPSLNKNLTIIGHSLGAVFLLRLLERMHQDIDTAIFVSGFTSQLGIPEYDLLNESFISDKFQWGRIKQNARNIHVVLGDNDPYVPNSQAVDLAFQLGVSPFIIKGGGHLNSEFGFVEFPLLMTLI